MDRAILTYVCRTVTASGTREQAGRYVVAVDSLDWAAIDVESSRAMRVRLTRLAERADLDASTRDTLAAVIRRTIP